jgi:CheY-like chemotaxis protein
MPLILIVEDEFAIADLLEMALTDAGYSVAVVANGREGLKRLAEAPQPDLLITDYMMPILDGAGLLQAMRRDETLRRIPCIVMSSIPEARVQNQIDGYAGFVRKPFQLARLVQLVGATLSREGGLDPKRTSPDARADERDG